MNPNQLRPRWLRKRVWLPVVLIAGLTVASISAFVNSDASTIIIYNETGGSISAIKVVACGQETVLHGMADERGGPHSANRDRVPRETKRQVVVSHERAVPQHG